MSGSFLPLRKHGIETPNDDDGQVAGNQHALDLKVACSMLQELTMSE